MRAGQLRHFITIERNSSTEAGDHGQPLECWKPLYKGVQASVVTLTGRELTFAHQMYAEADVQIKTRYLKDVKVTDRVKFQGKIYGIGAVLVGDRTADNRKLGLTLLCTEAIG